ncbi:hypothetical protein EVAR_91877_1 [Eumeta japonica]|uniref:Uncharacterized protein n=1 Tax=Eumeta variegata TaxID=151549 RepID=A0A4C1SZB7_EUMVA|nr:hypothetical protein EVAR_91877_1 [Eumeta japonica]
MGLPMLHRCCGCLSLEHGSIILAIVSLADRASFYCSALSLTRSAQAERDNESYFFVRAAGVRRFITRDVHSGHHGGRLQPAAEGQPRTEDNLISMSMVMFATLSAVCNVLLLVGICTCSDWLQKGFYTTVNIDRWGPSRHADRGMQLAMLFNALFVLFNFLVAAVTCLFSPEYKRAVVDKSSTIITFTIIGTMLPFVLRLLLPGGQQPVPEDEDDLWGYGHSGMTAEKMCLTVHVPEIAPIKLSTQCQRKF